MGAGTSSADNGTGFTFEGLIEEANQVLNHVSDVITQTVESETEDFADLQGRATTQV